MLSDTPALWGIKVISGGGFHLILFLKFNLSDSSCSQHLDHREAYLCDQRKNLLPQMLSEGRDKTRINDAGVVSEKRTAKNLCRSHDDTVGWISMKGRGKLRDSSGNGWRDANSLDQR